MQVAQIQRRLDLANKIRARLGAAPGTPVDRIIMKSGIRARDYSRACKEIVRHEAEAARLLGAGVELHKSKSC